MENGSGVNGARRPVRHKPQQQPNAVADYIQQSLYALAVSNTQQSCPSRRRKPRKRNSTKAENVPFVAEEASSWVVMVRNMVEADEMEDDDEFEEITADLTVDFERFGPLQSLDLDRETAKLQLVYTEEAHAKAAVETTHGRVYGGRQVTAFLVEKTLQDHTAPVRATVEQKTSTETESLAVKKRTRKRRTKIKNAVIKAQEALAAEVNAMTYRGCAFEVQNMVDAAEVEDDDEFEEILDDTTETLGKLGAVKTVSISRGDGDDPPGLVLVEYETEADAQAAFSSLDGKLFGGRLVRCMWREMEPAVTVVRVDGMLAVDELEDEDEFADIQDEVDTFFKQQQGVVNVEVSPSTGQVTVALESAACANAAMQRLAQTTYGGRKLRVQLTESTVSRQGGDTAETPVRESKINLQSVVDVSEVTRGLLTAFLERLAALQERAHVQNPLQDKRSRRLVLGLHEVRRGLASRKIKLLILASNLDECDVLDGKLDEIVSIAAREEVPILRAMSRRKLGRVLKKPARVSCIGVYSFDGAEELYQQIMSATRTTKPSVL